MYAKIDATKLKLHKAEKMILHYQNETLKAQSIAYVTEQSPEILAASLGETLALSDGKKQYKMQPGGFSLSASKKEVLGRANFRFMSAMHDIPEEGPTPSTTNGVQPSQHFEAPNHFNIQPYAKSMPKNAFGARSFARTEKHSMRSAYSTISNVSNFFRVTDSPFGCGVIPSSVLRAAMEKRQENLRQEGATAQISAQEELLPHEIMETS